MSISSRTPEGEPQRCPLCGKTDYLEPSNPGGDFICPSCGQLFFQLRRHISALGVPFDEITLQRRIAELRQSSDSLDIVEFIMEIEEKYDVTIPEEMAGQVQTPEDFLRLIIAALEEKE